MATREPTLSDKIVEEASSWFIDFNGRPVDAAGRAEFDAWLRRSPEHVRAYLQISAFWEEAGLLGKNSAVDLAEWVKRANVEHNVVQLGFNDGETLRPASDPVRARQARLLAIAASCLLAVAIGFTARYALYRQPTYVTDIGEQRTIRLDDGSTIELNARSRLSVNFSQGLRAVELKDGQALFQVAKDRSRPFVVTAGDTQVRAVGTQFDVYRKSSGTRVTVIEGQVAVMRTQEVAPGDNRAVGDVRANGSAQSATPEPAAVPPHTSGVQRSGFTVGPGEVVVAAGQQLQVTAEQIGRPRGTNVASAIAWTEKKLVFDSTPLGEVIEEFNRYNRQQLAIRDTELYNFHVSGEFPSTDPSRMIEFLRERFGVTPSQDGNRIEISRPEQ